METISSGSGRGERDNSWEMLGNESVHRALQMRESRGSGDRLTAEQRNTTNQAIIDYEKRVEREMTVGEIEAVIRSETNFYGEKKNRDTGGNLFNRAGEVFETGVTKFLIEKLGYVTKQGTVFATRERDLSTREANIVEDVLEGTDVVVKGLPIDVTLNAEKGGRIGSVDAEGRPISGFRRLGNLEGVKVSFGFRMENGNHELTMPVCVMLFESLQGERMSAEEMLEEIRKEPEAFCELVDESSSAYWDYIDATQGEED